MSFIESIKSCFKKYAVFDGRASRSEYWYWQLFMFLVLETIRFIAATKDIALVLQSTFLISVLFPSLSVAFRRVQDTNHSWWTAFVPLFNIYLYLIAGDKGENDFGEDPLM